jgi:CxxC motif-containing protein (DUF1111 family)
VFAALGEPLPTISAELRDRFLRGREVFLRRFAPTEGLGPEYSGASCGACHEKPVPGGTAARYRDAFVQTGLPRGFEVRFQPQFRATGSALARTPAGVQASSRTPQPLFGMGLLAEIPVEELLLLADPGDSAGGASWALFSRWRAQ